MIQSAKAKRLTEFKFEFRAVQGFMANGVKESKIKHAPTSKSSDLQLATTAAPDR